MGIFSQFLSKTQAQFFHLKGHLAPAPLITSLHHATVVQSGGQWKLSGHGTIMHPKPPIPSQPIRFHDIPFAKDWEAEIHVIGLWLLLLANLRCEDIHHGHVQQCHEPAGNSPSTKSTRGRSTRPLRKVLFSQSGPTMIRPDLNNFSA